MCYLTNSGSEANDLALRLAAAFSKSQDVLVMEDGYHGNIGSLVEVSPKMYKKKNMKKKDHVHISHLPDMFRGKYRYFDEERETQHKLGKIYIIISYLLQRARDSETAVGSCDLCYCFQLRLFFGFLGGHKER